MRSANDDRKRCGLCESWIPAVDYRTHVTGCGLMKTCGLCGKEVADLSAHTAKCMTGQAETCDRFQLSLKPKETIICGVCATRVEVDVYADHLISCGTRPTPTTFTPPTMKTCMHCAKQISAAQFVEHINACLSPAPADDEQCIICFKPVAKSEFQAHVHACLSRSSSTSSKPASKPKSISCCLCSTPVQLSKQSSHTVPCRTAHVYCLQCLRQSLNAQSRTTGTPVCPYARCDHELSRYDISCLPVDDSLKATLLALVKSEERAQCPSCLFYLDFKTIEDLQRHAYSCDLENMIPCEYCQCPQRKNRLDAHARECRALRGSERERTLVEFVTSRTKFPTTPAQIRVFINHRKRKHLPLDPRSIVDALADFGAVFPLEVPTLACDICMENLPHEDMFVFGCDDSHKSCYGCFRDACSAKMNSKELLTCVMCAHQLSDGELKHLRIPADQKREFIDYQVQKTFNNFSDATRGVIKCPNRQCTWVAVADNATDRFQVTCKKCRHQFCSLCNQQYHYQTNCAEIPTVTQRWIVWCTTERGNYWQVRAQQNAAFRAQLDDYERQKAANEQRNQELRLRYNELQADETYKAQNCRLCPNCQRVVQHMGGCPSMVCGRNYHGGDQQSGCGASFRWDQATLYTPIINGAPEQVRDDLPRPEEQAAVVHRNIHCDSCGEEVQGIRFDCCQCPSLIYCEKCEQRATLKHSEDVRQQDKQQHVFRIIPRPIDAQE